MQGCAASYSNATWCKQTFDGSCTTTNYDRVLNTVFDETGPEESVCSSVYTVCLMMTMTANAEQDTTIAS